MSQTTQERCRLAIANGEEFHNNTRLTGIDIHRNVRDYKNEYSFSGKIRRLDNGRYVYLVYSYDRVIAYRYLDDVYWYVDTNTRGISQTTDHHLNTTEQAIDHDYVVYGEYPEFPRG